MALEWMDNPDWLAPPRTERIPLDGGSFVLRSPEPLQPHARCIGEWLEQWATQTPYAPAFAERNADGTWTRLTWAQARQAVGRLAQGLLSLRLPPGAPVVILSDNAVAHLLLALSAMHVGIPVCTVSSAYSRLTKDHGKLRGILAALSPGLVYASDAAVYGPAIRAGDLTCPVVFGQGAQVHPGAIEWTQLMNTEEGPDVRAAYERITPDTHAKYLLTSGSTGQPKVVINTHRMLCANQQMVAQAWRFLAHEKPVLVDWLPWSHTFGGNHNLHLVMRNGGTLVIDEGRPAPGLVEKSIANMAQEQPTLWFNVPRGFDMALPLLEADEALARRALARLRMIFYAGAGLPQATWERMQALVRRVRGQEIWMTTSWGATETSPAVTSAHWRLERAGVIGGPLPGLELKFVPNGSKLEMRVRGVSVFPGYLRAPELTSRAFDEEGYYCIGDAGVLADDGQPERGVAFNGRVAEDFKLASGTWVSVGTLRVNVVSALAPLAQDVVVTGHDRDEVGVLVFPTAQAAAASPEAVAQQLRAALERMRAAGGASSQCPTRALVLAQAPSVDAGEITDKGYINQRAVLERRSAEVERLYAGGPDVILVARPTP